MLVLSRNKAQSILIGDDIRITVLNCDHRGASIGIEAPHDLLILREELKSCGEKAPQTITQQMRSVLSRRLSI